MTDPKMTRTKYPSRVYDPGSPLLHRVLGLGENNRKLGRTVAKGRFKGYTIRTLSLEERVTCPTSCGHWIDCYGNNMPWAKRIDHKGDMFLPRLEAELDHAVETAKVGVLVRLHVLGDFYSDEYVEFWRRMLNKHPTLAAWGYTAYRWGTGPVYQALVMMAQDFEGTGRWSIRTSNFGAVWGTESIKSEEEWRRGTSFICPEQTGKTKSCATCGACWSTPKNVAFIDH